MPTDLPPKILEKNLAEKIGVDRSVLFQLRVDVLKPDLDWTRDGNAIAYLQAGVDKVCTHLHLERLWVGTVPPPLPSPEKNEPEKKEGAVLALPGPVKLKVLRRARLNTRIIFAQEKEGAPEIAVRVRDNTAFRAGQEIQATVHGLAGELYGAQPRPRVAVPFPKR